MPSGKRRVHSVSGRHYDVFRKVSDFFSIISDLYRAIAKFTAVIADIECSFLNSTRPLLL